MSQIAAYFWTPPHENASSKTKLELMEGVCALLVQL